MKTHLSLPNTCEFLYQMLLIFIGFQSWKSYICFSAFAQQFKYSEDYFSWNQIWDSSEEKYKLTFEICKKKSNCWNNLSRFSHLSLSGFFLLIAFDDKQAFIVS